MRKKIGEWFGRYRCMDWAVLYMRLFAGGMLLFHNIGKVQHYNEIIDSYPSLFYIDNAAVFVFATAAEVLLAVLVMLGLWVRMSALGVLLMFAWGAFGAGEKEFIWLGIYVFLVISGAGYYGFDWVRSARKAKK